MLKLRGAEKRRLDDAVYKMNEQRDRIERRKLKETPKPDDTKDDDDHMTMDGNSVYSKVGPKKKYKGDFSK